LEKHIVSELCMEEGNWWLEVVTNEPYLYLFGSFDTTEDAYHKSSEYFKDLVSEGWNIVSTKMTQIGPMVIKEERRGDLVFQAQLSE
jgi:Domain of unknown function (DUF1816)